MKIAILGTRGIPNYYGGFEQFAQYLSLGLIQKGFEVYVYSPHNHKYLEKTWKGVNILHQFDPEYKIGTIGQFVYDLNCILDSRKRDFDIILQLGYTSSSIWNFLFKKPAVILTNMDGLEWKRSKYGKMTRKFLKRAEAIAVKRSDHLISDSLGIKKYLLSSYNVDSTYIPYGADVFKEPDESILKKYNLEKYKYNILIARLEPENSIQVILDGVASSTLDHPFIVIGNNNTIYGEFLVKRYQATKKIIFLGSIYDIIIVNNLRYFSNLYFHGHTVGGTNPSLLEAMSSGALIVAHQNEFNSSILEGDAYYFKNQKDVTLIVDSVEKNQEGKAKIEANIVKINMLYSWQNIINQYEALFVKVYEAKKEMKSD